jgi:hypothetical protein
VKTIWSGISQTLFEAVHAACMPRFQANTTKLPGAYETIIKPTILSITGRIAAAELGVHKTPVLNRPSETNFL